MRVVSARNLTVLLGLFAWALPASAAVYAPITDQEILRRADAVVVAAGAENETLAPKRSRMLRRVRIEPSSAAGIEGRVGTRS